MEFGRELDGSSGRPEWLRDDDQVMGYWLQWHGPYRVEHVTGFGEEYFKFKLPIDHFAYKALDAGFEPWGGGDEGPDHDAVLWRDGNIHGASEFYRWNHLGVSADIIGYRKRTEPNDETREAMTEIQNGEVERFETVGELMEDLSKEYLVQNVTYSGYTVGKVYEHVIGSDDVYDDDGDCRHYFDDHFRPATSEEISVHKQENASEVTAEKVLVRRMTREEAGDLCQYTLACLGLLIDETPIQRFEREHGGLDDNQRDIVEAFIEWSAGK